MQNRELSWLAFNERVLSEATDETVPLLERLKFISIFSSNLDEFFMIRVGSLFDLKNLHASAVDKRSGWSPAEQLDAIYAAVRPLYKKQEDVYSALEKQLRVHGICALSFSELENSEKKFCTQYFNSTIAPIAAPQIVDTHHPFPHLKNTVLHIGAWVKFKSKEVFAVTPLPDTLPPVLFLPGKDLRYIRMEELLLAFFDTLFPGYTIQEKMIFRITRNADINPDDEAFDFDNDDFRKKMKKVLRQRMRLAPVRLELSRAVSAAFLRYLKERLPVTDQQIFITSAPLRLGYAFALSSKLPEGKRRALTYAPFVPCWPADLHKKEAMTPQIQKKGHLLSYPFESMSPFLHLIREAAEDPNVLSIKITIYRLAHKAKLVDYLCSAAEHGKDVTVLIELRARFDEQNNIEWSERMEEAGCRVLYGFEGYKVHSKICLITYRSRNEIRYITQIGTGNYNEKTAKMYTDYSLMTSSQEIGEDAAVFFKNMSIGNLNGEYRHLIVSPSSLKQKVLALMDEEIRKGADGRILMKMNSVTDMDFIRKTAEASQAGVKIDLIVRGICCILPGIPGKTENLRVTSIVGRFLEHPRVFIFGSGPEAKVYIGSADMMTRNTEKRVEVACPIYDETIRRRLKHCMKVMLSDNLKAREMMPDGT